MALAVRGFTNLDGIDGAIVWDAAGNFKLAGLKSMVSVGCVTGPQCPLRVINGHDGLHQKASALPLKADILRGG
jgi:hypothetical protein